MSTKLKTAMGSPVKPDSILETLQQHLRWENAYGSFIKRMLAKAEKGAITAADREAIERRARKQQHRQEGIEGLASAYPDAAWAKAYRAEEAPRVA
jgi:hypothetical protein